MTMRALKQQDQRLSEFPAIEGERLCQVKLKQKVFPLALSLLSVFLSELFV